METMFVIKSILSAVFTLKKLLNFTFFWLSLILVKKRGGGLSFDLVAIIVYRSRCLFTNRNINIGVNFLHSILNLELTIPIGAYKGSYNIKVLVEV